jgi:hypothetical protein
MLTLKSREPLRMVCMARAVSALHPDTFVSVGVALQNYTNAVSMLTATAVPFYCIPGFQKKQSKVACS